MFIEPKRGKGKGNKVGWIEVVCGSMFSGKTEELIRRLNRAKIAQQKVAIFKPKVDIRYHATNVVTHNQAFVTSFPVENPADILNHVEDCDVVGIDEAQFFDNEIVQIANRLANEGKRVIIAGLDLDSNGIPFGEMPALMAIAEFVTKVHAICVNCGDIAQYSYRKVANNNHILLGEIDSYEALCRKCFLEKSEV